MDFNQIMQFLQQYLSQQGGQPTGPPQGPQGAAFPAMPQPAQYQQPAGQQAAPMRPPATWQDAYGRTWYGASKPADMASWQANNDRVLPAEFKQPQFPRQPSVPSAMANGLFGRRPQQPGQQPAPPAGQQGSYQRQGY